MRRGRDRGGEEGQTLVEFVLVAPVLLLILFGIVQFGVAFKNSMVVTDAVRAGARKAAVSSTATNPTATAQQAVIAAAGDLDPSKLQVVVTSTWRAGDSVTVSASLPVPDRHSRNRRHVWRFAQHGDRASRIAAI